MNDLMNLHFRTTGIIESGRRTDGTLALPLPAPRCEVAVRAATLEDLPFIDRLQKMHSHMVGFAPRTQLEANVKGGHVLIAEAYDNGHIAVGMPPAQCHPVGYIIFKDQYFKRDDVGIVYQLNVLPLKQRSLIGATLVKSAFERAAYGCKLFCCWCAQDIQANWFWESIGFVPLAFRTGSASKQRIHIFWQRRIREGDEVTPYWFPSQTQNGAVRADRLVIPIPPGVHWRDAMPVVLPGGSQLQELPQEDEKPKCLPETLPGGAPLSSRPEQVKLSAAQKAAILRSNAKELGGVPIGKKAVIRNGSIKYVDRSDFVPELDMPEELKEPPKVKRPRKKSVQAKTDPELVKAARELRDRFLEQANTQGSGLMLPPGAWGKYDVSRQLEGAPAAGNSTSQSGCMKLEPPKLLEAA